MMNATATPDGRMSKVAYIYADLNSPMLMHSKRSRRAASSHGRNWRKMLVAFGQFHEASTM